MPAMIAPMLHWMLPNPIPEAGGLVIEQTFQAYTSCPHCGHLAVHWVVAPRVCPPTLRAYRRDPSAWLAGLPQRWEDADFVECVRECVSCGRGWGVAA